MKLHRFWMIALSMAVLVVCMGFLLNGCASIGKGKKAGSETESARQSDERSPALKETSGSSPAAEKKSAVETPAAPEQERTVKKAVSKPATAAKSVTAAKPAKAPQGTAASKPVKKALPAAPRHPGRPWTAILAETLKNLNWNRITPILMGTGVLALIYGLAFGLGRMHLRRRSIPRREEGVRQTRPQGEEPAYS